MFKTSLFPRKCVSSFFQVVDFKISYFVLERGVIVIVTKSRRIIEKINWS